MQNLTLLIDYVYNQEDETPEDIFASAPGVIFTDDLRNLHGDPDTELIYRSGLYGPIKLRTADPQQLQDRLLFAHHLWNAGILMAERISGLRMLDPAEVSKWTVKGESVIELGAGVGLSGMVAQLAGAKEVVITDYPSSDLLDNIQRNLDINTTLFPASRPLIQGHEWGVLDDEFSITNKNHFTRVIAADCFWMPNFHVELVSSMLHFLTLDTSARVLAIGGFHTGRDKLAKFFEVAQGLGLVPEEIYEEDAEGVRREWYTGQDFPPEDRTERKKWLTLAVMQRSVVE